MLPLQPLFSLHPHGAVTILGLRAPAVPADLPPLLFLSLAAFLPWHPCFLQPLQAAGNWSLIPCMRHGFCFLGAWLMLRTRPGSSSFTALTEAEQSKCPYREGLLHWKKLLVGMKCG